MFMDIRIFIYILYTRRSVTSYTRQGCRQTGPLLSSNQHTMRSKCVFVAQLARSSRKLMGDHCPPPSLLSGTWLSSHPNSPNSNAPLRKSSAGSPFADPAWCCECSAEWRHSTRM